MIFKFDLLPNLGVWNFKTEKDISYDDDDENSK